MYIDFINQIGKAGLRNTICLSRMHYIIIYFYDISILVEILQIHTFWGHDEKAC